jgi:KRAB domain-containing zinc finger protein
MSQLSSHCRKSHQCLPQVHCLCGKSLSTWKRLLIHKQKHFPEKFDYECKECKMVYKMKASFLNHMKQKHGPDARKFVCSQCARCFKDSRTLLAHEKTHLPNELKLIYPCDICQKKFVNKNSLKSHITSVHEMASLYTCEHCGKSFSTKSNLKSHLYSHTSEKVRR